MQGRGEEEMTLFLKYFAFFLFGASVGLAVIHTLNDDYVWAAAMVAVAGVNLFTVHTANNTLKIEKRLKAWRGEE
jgi:NhaP-type Na+/H+ or K+/H+ antiporter